MTAIQAAIAVEQRLIIRDMTIAEEMIARHERSPNAKVFAYVNHWRGVKRALFDDYQRVSEKWGKA